MVVLESMKSESDELEEVKSIGPMNSQAYSIIEISHIDFIFKDPQVKANDCDLVIQILHPIRQGSIKARSVCQQHTSILSIFSLKKSLSMSKSCEDNEEHATNLKFICWIFDFGGHL
eukprot:TRINITY_DN20599_c0_g2_i1.p1 TRINITY_DN20599_c0_g2~~TRINITY_DN20599_c0_g2_i1.p1  ORF type:complete len:117 (-),score=9.60 TRINITY_DN20599_c0_g2_i1:10-360(-)